MAINLMISFTVAAMLRCLLMSSNISNLIQNRVEVSTPLNSWKRSEQKKKLALSLGCVINII